MAVTFTVQADSEAEAAEHLQRLCTALGLTPLGRPMELPGRGRWMARATGQVASVGDHMRLTTGAWLAAAGLLLAGCSSSSGDGETEPSESARTATRSATAKTERAHLGLEPKWRPKLEKASPDATALCQTPSSDACATALSDIMTVVYDLEETIREAGVTDTYPKTLKQVTKMTDAANGYVDDACQGDPAAELDSSACYGYGVTMSVGATTLTFILGTDESKAETAAKSNR